MKVRVLVTLKPGVLDVQGRAVARGLSAEGFDGVLDCRVGRLVELELAETEPGRLTERVRAMCEALLANPVIERYEIVLPVTRFGVVVFPGTNCDDDVLHVVRLLGGEGTVLRHTRDDLGGVDVVVLPGGFSYGDYLRSGALARHAPIMSQIAAFAHRGGPVLGICNGFQILVEAGLLPGAFTRNEGTRFVCRDERVVVDGAPTPFTRTLLRGARLTLPVAHAEGRYVADGPTLERLEGEGRVVLRYEQNPNGSMHAIAGVASERGNVVGLMPHPERACETLLGNEAGRAFFESVLHA